MTDEPVPDWMRPASGFTATDLDHLPQLPARTELIDGNLILAGPQTYGHMRLVTQLHTALSQAAPEGVEAVREMSVILTDRQRPAPDVALIEAAYLNDEATWYPADAVRLAIEVVSQATEILDRDRKPQLYARSGIRHYWRVETSGGKPVVHVYELDPATSTYVPTGIHHDRLKLTVPFPIDVDLNQ